MARSGHISAQVMHPVQFFFNDTATTEIYTLPRHDALPIYRSGRSPRLSRASGVWEWNDAVALRSDPMRSRAATEPAAHHVGALRLRLLHDAGGRRGDVRDALAGHRRPLAAVEIPLLLRIKVIVRQRVPRPKRRVIVSDAGHVTIIGIDGVRAECWRLVRSAAGQRPGGQAADQHQAYAAASFHGRLTPSAQHGGSDND